MTNDGAWFEAIENCDGRFDVRLHGIVRASGEVTEYNLLNVNRVTAQAAADHLAVPIVWGECPSKRRRWLRRVRVYVFGPKPWPDVLGEFVGAAMLGGMMYGAGLLLGWEAPVTLAWGVGLGYFMRGIRR